MNKVIWKDIMGYEGLYQISSNGEIMNIQRKSLRKPREDKDGYLLIDLSKNNQAKTFRLNRLVAEHFLYIPDNYKELAVDHINSNRQDNRVENLQWVTAKENNSKRDMANIQKIIIQIDKKTNEPIQEFDSIREASRVVGTSHTNIIRVLDNPNLTAGGFKWRVKNV